MRERDVENRLRMRCRQEGFRALKFVSPGMTGVPDRLILVPGGYVVFVELKAPGKVERPRQIIAQNVIKSFGHTVMESVDSYEKVEEVIGVCRAMAKLAKYSNRTDISDIVSKK